MEKKRGPKSKYNPILHDKLAEVLAGVGKTDVEIAQELGIARSTLALWKKEHPEFGNVLQEAKDTFDSGTVEQALLKRALGYDFEETTSELRKNEAGEEEWVVVKKVTKHIPSSDVSKIFWLKNRQPQRWSDKKEIDHRIEGITEPLTEEELMERLKRVKEAGTGIDTKSIEGNGNGNGSNKATD